MLHGKIGVGQGLGLHALGGIHHQHGALTGRQGPGDFIVEVHVARRIDQVQLIELPVPGLVRQPHRPGLDRDAPLPLQVHVVQQLLRHLPLGHRLAPLQQTVRQGGLAVVDMGDDGKISNIALFRHSSDNLHRPSPAAAGTPFIPKAGRLSGICAAIRQARPKCCRNRSVPQTPAGRPALPGGFPPSGGTVPRHGLGHAVGHPAGHMEVVGIVI